MSGPSRAPLPDIVIGGAPRSGTTFLCELLAKHPQVFVARPFIPEPKVLLLPHADGDAGVARLYADYFAAAPAANVRVEKTSHLFENDRGRDRVTRLLPQTRLIFILREPIARAYSNWLRSRKNGLENLDFREAVEAEGRRASPFGPEKDYVRPFDYMTRGQYARFAQSWISSIGRERIAFFIFEEAIARPVGFVSRLQDFIGVDRLPWSALATGVVNPNEPAPADVDAQFAAELRQRISGEMRRLAEITGLDVGIWGY